MSIKLEITGDTPEEFTKHFAGVVSVAFGRVANAVGMNPERPAASKTIEHDPSEKVEKDTPEREPEHEREAKTETDTRPRRRGRPPKARVEEEPEVEAEPERKEQDVTVADVKKALLDLLEAKGDEAPMVLLKGFGAKKVSEVRVADYAAVIAGAKKMMDE